MAIVPKVEIWVGDRYVPAEALRDVTLTPEAEEMLMKLAVDCKLVDNWLDKQKAKEAAGAAPTDKAES